LAQLNTQILLGSVERNFRWVQRLLLRLSQFIIERKNEGIGEIGP